MRLALRTFLPAALLGGLMVPMAGAQQVYTYSDLSRNGNTIFGYVETDLWSPYWYCGWGCGGVYCWEEYTTFAQATLYLGDYYEWVGSYWWEQPNGWASAWVWYDVDVGAWRLRAEHELWDLWYQDEYCFSYWIPYWRYERYPWPQVTVDPLISITSWQSTDDGDGAYFDVTAEIGQPTGYSWSFDYPSGAGNNPNVQFTPDYYHFTNTDAHWFAYPDDECYAPPQSAYDITATVGFRSVSGSATSGLTVVVPWVPGGETVAPALEEHIWIGFVDGLWRVLPETYFVRLTPLVLVYVPWTSQFHNKAYEHEQVHHDQFTPGGNYHTLEGMRNPADARAAIIDLTDSTEQGLAQKVNAALYSYYLNEAAAYLLYLRDPAEREAYGVSDNISPRYLYQNCGRY